MLQALSSCQKTWGNGNATLYFRVRRTAATSNMVHTGRKKYKSTDFCLQIFLGFFTEMCY